LEHPVDVHVYTIDKQLHLQRLAKSISKVLRDEIKASLLHSRESMIPGWIVDMVVDWIEATFFPFSKTKQNGGEAYVVTQFSFQADEISQLVQDFYADVTDAVVAKSKKHWKRQVMHRSGNSGGRGTANDQESSINNTDEEMDSSAEKEKEASSFDTNQEVEKQDMARQLVDRIEGTICDVLYDRQV
jgi:hypothetical protein